MRQLAVSALFALAVLMVALSVFSVPEPEPKPTESGLTLEQWYAVENSPTYDELVDDTHCHEH